MALAFTWSPLSRRFRAFALWTHPGACSRAATGTHSQDLTPPRLGDKSLPVGPGAPYRKVHPSFKVKTVSEGP
jgi:hypothetical protein